MYLGIEEGGTAGLRGQALESGPSRRREAARGRPEERDNAVGRRGVRLQPQISGVLEAEVVVRRPGEARSGGRSAGGGAAMR